MNDPLEVSQTWGTPSSHPFFLGFSNEINHPAIKGVPPFNSVQGRAGAPPQMGWIRECAQCGDRSKTMKFVEDDPNGSI